MRSLEVIKKLERKKKLSLIEKILAVTNGSVTQILEMVIGEAVEINTLSQEVGPAGEMAGALGVSEMDDINFRDVEIKDSKGNVLVRARSWTPLKRLEPEFKEDLMKANVPIGKLLIKHGIEARRELLEAWIEDGKLKRTYDIIREGEVLMRIEEEFENRLPT